MQDIAAVKLTSNVCCFELECQKFKVYSYLTIQIFKHEGPYERVKCQNRVAVQTLQKIDCQTVNIKLVPELSKCFS